MHIIFFLVCLGASIIGAICGIGGGVIIKPSLDALGGMSVSAISFLSGCTVLSMTSYAVIKSKLEGTSTINMGTGTPLALGAAVGGVAGKALFESLSSKLTDKEMVGAIQAVCLLVITIGTLIYALNRTKIKTYQVQNLFICIVLGGILGILSSFLGIGGGPVNLVILYYFFSMPTKAAAENSLYIILFSQITSLLSTLLSGKVPEFPFELLFLMMIAGIVGGICGRKINKKIEASMVDKLAIYLMIVLIGINTYNILKFT